MTMRVLGYLSPAAIVLLAASLALPQSTSNKAGREWAAYGGNPEDTRYSPLKQINRSNVSKLQVAWSYDASDGRGGLETNPLVVDGLVYGNTPGGKLIALDGATGKLVWSWVSKSRSQRTRGFTYWADGADRRVFFGYGRYVYALDAKTGLVISGFGSGGRIDLQQDLDRPPEQQSVTLTTPGVIYKDLLIFGGEEAESLPASYGDIRAYDTRTGKLRWTFHTIPRPGEFGYETWPKDAWTYIGSANNWAGMAVDRKRGIVYVPTGSAASDFYGANRVGDDLFANCLIALDAKTGKRLWHFQAVKHDLWDRDFPSPPSLVTVRRNGRQVDAVAQTTKHGYVFLFDRTDGKPLFPIESRKYPASTVPGEVAAETQPLPTRPAPFARQALTESMLTNRTPQAHQWALEQFRNFISDGQFVPPGVGTETVIFPGFDGGAEWGGSAFDPESGLLYVNSTEMAWTSSLAETGSGMSGRQVYLTQCAVCHRDDLTGAPPQIPSLADLASRRKAAEVSAVIRQGAGRMPGFPNLSRQALDALVQFAMSGEEKEMESKAASPVPSGIAMKYRFTGYHKFVDAEGYPAVAPPWGTLNAINLNTGEYAWKIPLGE